MKFKFHYVTLFLLLFIVDLNAQNKKLVNPTSLNELKFYLFDVENGLSNNYINSIEQDSLGYIWVATADGLNRYDSFKFSRYTDENTEGLSNNNIEQINYDYQTNSLIIATDKGLNKLDLKYEKFNPLFEKQFINNEVINCFAIDYNNNAIVGTLRNNAGLYIISKKGNVESFQNSNESNSISNNEISSLVFQNDSTLWIGTFHGGVNKMNYKNKKIVQIGQKEDQFSKYINDIYIDHNDNVWIGSKNGLKVITSKNDTLTLKSSLIKEKGLSDNNVLSFEEDNYGRMWIGTRNGGLNVLNIDSFLSKKKEIEIKWFLPKNDGTSVFNRTVSCIKKDSKGNIWLGTSTGLNFVNPIGEATKELKKNDNSVNSISHNRVGSLTNSKNGNIWIGTDGGGLDLLNPNTGSFKHFTYSKSNSKSLSNNYIISLLEDSKERVWVGTYQGGLNLLNTETSNAIKFLPNYDIRVIFEDGLNQIWIGTNRGGLFKFNEREQSFEYISFLGNLDIRDIQQGKNNDLWLATFGDGIVWFNPSKNDAIFFNTNNTEGLKTNVFFSLLTLENGDVLAGSRYRGLIRLNPNEKIITILTEKDGLSNNTINSIVREDKDFIWLGTSNGLNRFNIKTNKIYNLGSFNNTQQKEFTIGASLKSKNGTLYFGTNKGVIIFYPDRLKNNEETFKLIFQDILVLNKSVKIKPNDSKAILNKSISYEDKLILNYKHSLFSLGFTVLKYPISKNINYSYLLDGYHKHWIQLKENKLANFSNIPAGNYTLKVKGLLDSGNVINNQINVVIKPPFWLTTPAYVIYFIVIISIISLVLKYYHERVKLKNSLLFEKKQRALEQEINEERIHFFTSFSHELKTPLTLILAPLDDLIKKSKTLKSKKDLDLIKRNAKNLYKSIHKLLVFRKSEMGLSQLNIQKVNISNTLYQSEQRFEVLAKKKSIRFSLELPSSNIFAWVDPEKFQIIMNNLISNAFQHTENKGSISISLSKVEDYLKVIVKDSGSGIDQKDLPYIFNWYFHSGRQKTKRGTGVGLALTKNFVELHKGTIKAENNIKSKGTSFILKLPIVKLKELQKAKTKTTEESSSIIDIWGPNNKIIEKANSKKIKLNKKRKLVLLMDDNQDILSYLESLLQEKYDLIYANNGKDGIDKATKYIPDIIISDIMMPVKSGIDVCKTLKNQPSTTHIPIILLSAKENPESVKTGFKEGADAYITKPFNKDILLTRILNLLKNRDQLKEYFSSKEPTLLDLSSNKIKLLDKEKIFLKKFNEIILKNLKNENINIEMLSKEIGMSRSSLFRKIKAITGKNINEYIRKIRIEKAAYLIKEENTTISQASYEVGFNSINYFRKVFKEELGVLPSSLKKS